MNPPVAVAYVLFVLGVFAVGTFFLLRALFEGEDGQELKDRIRWRHLGDPKDFRRRHL